MHVHLQLRVRAMCQCAGGPVSNVPPMQAARISNKTDQKMLLRGLVDQRLLGIRSHRVHIFQDPNSARHFRKTV